MAVPTSVRGSTITHSQVANEKVWVGQVPRPNLKKLAPSGGKTSYLSASASRHTLRDARRVPRNLVACAGSALEVLTVSQQQVSQLDRTASNGGPALEVTLHQIVPALVRQLSTGNQQPSAYLQLVRTSPWSQLDMEYKALQSSELNGSEVWKHVLSSSDQSTRGQLSMVVLASPIPDPSSSCPLSAYSSPLNNQPAQPSHSHTSPTCDSSSSRPSNGTCGVTELEGAVDLDGCCGGKDPAVAADDTDDTTMHTQYDTDTHYPPPSSPRRDSASPVGTGTRTAAVAARTAAPSLSSSTSPTSNCSSGGGNSTFLGLPLDPPQPVAPVAARSRRRFLRRQLAAQAQAQGSSQGRSSSQSCTTATTSSQHPMSSYSAAGGHAQTTYWGLAVQSVGPDGMARAGQDGMSGMGYGSRSEKAWCKQTGQGGCYVLKMSRNRDLQTGCTCTMFSLTRVCKGQPLYQQLQEVWLAH